MPWKAPIGKSRVIWKDARMLVSRQDAGSIPADAVAIHGITNADVTNVPTSDGLPPEYFPELLVRVEVPTAVYNADCDLRLMDQSSEEGGARSDGENAHCIMELYAVSA